MVSAVCFFRFAVIVIDSIKDPTSHNLFPFEILITGIFAFAVVFPAGYLGEFIRIMAGKNRAKNDNTKVKTSKIAFASFLAGISPIAVFGAALILWDIYSWTNEKIYEFILSLKISLSTGAFALILGVTALHMIRQSNGTVKGKGWAVMGIMIGSSTWLVFRIIAVLF